MIRRANVVGVPIGVPVFNSQASSWNRRKTHEIIAVRVHGWGIAVGWSHIVIAIAVIPPTDEARKPPEDGTELDGLQLRCISDFPRARVVCWLHLWVSHAAPDSLLVL